MRVGGGEVKLPVAIVADHVINAVVTRRRSPVCEPGRGSRAEKPARAQRGKEFPWQRSYPDRALDILVRTDMQLAEIALLECGGGHRIAEVAEFDEALRSP